MRLDTILSLGLFVFCSFVIHSQNRVDLRLDFTTYKNNLHCFNVDLKSPHGQDILLGGQNYRLFYDANKLRYEEKANKTFLHSKAYTDLEVISTIQGNIGFLSISIDAKELNDHVVQVSRNGQWTTTANLCFHVLSNKNFDLTWANLDKTSHFASASVAFSEWITKDKQQVLEPNEIIDYSSYDLKEDLSGEIQVKVYPNPVMDYVRVDLDTNGESRQLIIKDIIGREVVYDQVKGKTSMNYDLTNWPDGVYTLEIFESNGQLVYTNNLVKINQ